MRAGFLTLFLLPLSITFFGHSATTYILTMCTESEFDVVLESAKVGDSLRFDCTGTIEITQSKKISRDITIDGNRKVILMARGAASIFTISPKVTVAIHGLTLVNGGGDEQGSGAIENYGMLTVTDSTITRNGQAIYNRRGAVLNISNSVISKNEHGLLNYGGTMTAHHVTFEDNLGDGIYNSNQLTVTASTFIGNAHGIDNGSGEVTIANSLFYANKARKGQMGGGIANSGTASILNSTFMANEAEGSGAAIGNRSQGRVLLINSVIADSQQGQNCLGKVIDGGHNVQFPGTSCGKSILVADPQLEFDRSDSTPVAVRTSPIIGSGDVRVCNDDPVNNADLRGHVRVEIADPTCDIGAFEISASSTSLAIGDK